MLDKSIPYYPVAMVKAAAAPFPRVPLAEGYTFIRYQAGLEREWAKLQFETGQTTDFDATLKRFEEEYRPQIELAKSRCWFVKETASNAIIGTASLWRGNLFGEMRDRIHWVAVSQAHSGKGIGKALLAKLLEESNDEIYLTTQSWSYPAIGMYLKFGFQPYLGKRPINWKHEDFEQTNEQAWELIRSKLV